MTRYNHLHPRLVAQSETRLEALAFYLDERQCARVNDARARLEAHRNATSNIRIGWTPMTPDPNMDNSYYVKE